MWLFDADCGVGKMLAGDGMVDEGCGWRWIGVCVGGRDTVWWEGE